MAANWCRILDHFGADLSSFQSIYEIGCGTCRLLRHFRCFRTAKLTGSDVNPDMIEWSRANIPGIEIHQNELEPPLDFSSETFDLVLALSVFTHIPMEWQSAWIRELKRVLRPAGILLCTVAGENHVRLQLDPQQRAELIKRGQLTLQAGDRGVSLSTKVGGSRWDVFQTADQIRQAFGAEFDLIDVIPGGQELLVLQKPGGAENRQLQGEHYPGQSFGSLD